MMMMIFWIYKANSKFIGFPFIYCFGSWVIGMQDMQLEDLSLEFSGNIFLNHKSYQ